MSKITVNYLPTQEQLHMFKKAGFDVEVILNQENASHSVGAKKTTAKPSNEKPKTKKEAIEEKYGDSVARKNFVLTEQKKAFAEAKKLGFKVEKGEHGELKFLPYKKQDEKKFPTHKNFTKAREAFRKAHQYA